VRYVDRLTEPELRTHYPELSAEAFVPVSIIGNAEDLSALADGSVDFVIANHLIEHLENPIGGLQEMTRVLRNGGVLYMALPDPRATFDRDRPPTPFAHVLDEYRNGTSSTREAHFAEWVALAEPYVEWLQEPGVKKGAERVGELLQLDYSIHYHVWRPQDFFEFVVLSAREVALDLEPLEFLPCNRSDDNEYILICRKGASLPLPDLPRLPSETDVDELRARVASLTTAHDRVVGEMGGLQDEVAHLRAHIDSLMASRSWRVTAPLRAGVRMARTAARAARAGRGDGG